MGLLSISPSFQDPRSKGSPSLGHRAVFAAEKEVRVEPHNDSLNCAQMCHVSLTLTSH